MDEQAEELKVGTVQGDVGVIIRQDVAVIHGVFIFFFQAEDGIRDLTVTGVQTCALPILKTTDKSAVAARPGAVNGSTIRVMIVRKPAPSRLAASRISFGRSAKKERIIQITRGRLNAA